MTDAAPQTIDAKLVQIIARFDDARVPYAIGGAMAAGVWSEPRDTQDIDIAVFLPESRAAEVLDALEELGIEIDRPETLAVIEHAGQVRILWSGTFIDLFFAYHELHDSVRNRTVTLNVRGLAAPVLSAEDITIFKTLFNRPQDWIDIEKVIATQGERFDGDYALDWAGRILGTKDAAYLRLSALIREYRENPV